MFEYVDVPEPSLQAQVASDVRDVLVSEYGYPDTLKTLGLAVLQHCFAGHVARNKARMDPPGEAEHERLWKRRGLVPKHLSFWVNAMVGAAGRERHVANMNYLYDRRLIDGRMTQFDL